MSSARSRSAIRSSGCSRPIESRSSVSGVRVSGPSIDCRCSIRLSTPPRLVARVKILVSVGQRHRRGAIAFQLERKHPAERIHLPRGEGVLRVRGRDPGNEPARHADGEARNSATRSAFSQCARIRQGSVCIRDAPASNRMAPAPRRRSLCISRTRWKNSSSSRAMSAPPRTSLWPPKYFVVECMTRSAPSANGR